MNEPLIFQWDGRSLPGELRGLSAGRYIVAPDDLLDELHEDEDRPHTVLNDFRLDDNIVPAKVLARLFKLSPGRYLIESADTLVELTSEEEKVPRGASGHGGREPYSPSRGDARIASPLARCVIIEYTPQARQDFGDALAYLGLHNPTAAARLRRRIEQAIDRLASGFIEGRPVQFRGQWDARVSFSPRYGVYYRRADNHLVILLIYLQARRPIE